jgi:hypothetical protein
VVYVTRSGSGNEGSLLAWSTTKFRSLVPILKAELSGNSAKGYRRQDQRAVVEGSPSSRFQIYNLGAAYSKPPGGLRQINDTLMAGEASWQ